MQTKYQRIAGSCFTNFKSSKKCISIESKYFFKIIPAKINSVCCKVVTFYTELGSGNKSHLSLVGYCQHKKLLYLEENGRKELIERTMKSQVNELYEELLLYS